MRFAIAIASLLILAGCVSPSRSVGPKPSLRDVYINETARPACLLRHPAGENLEQCEAMMWDTHLAEEAKQQQQALLTRVRDACSPFDLPQGKELELCWRTAIAKQPDKITYMFSVARPICLDEGKRTNTQGMINCLEARWARYYEVASLQQRHTDAVLASSRAAVDLARQQQAALETERQRQAWKDFLDAVTPPEPQTVILAPPPFPQQTRTNCSISPNGRNVYCNQQ